MRKIYFCIIVSLFFAHNSRGQTLVFHNIQTDAQHKLVPWYSANNGEAYDHCLGLIWDFWKRFPSTNGVKNYMTDHAYCQSQCSNKIGGDQFAMALSSWALYYQYTGDTSIISDMRYIADNYLANSMSAPTDAWPNIPYPCNYGNTSTAVYDGDFLLGAGYTQPDKAASFGAELITLYKITGDTTYLNAAVKIANTIADKLRTGNSSKSPIPFKVKASDGSILLDNTGFQYTANVTGILQMFEQLSPMRVGHTTQYDSGYALIKRWVQQYPQQNNNWGCFFEDISLPSNTETNAVTMAYYIMEHPDWSGNSLADTRSILDWTMNTLGSHAYDTIGARAIYEQTVDLKEGGSHTSRFASAELLYTLLSGDTSRLDQSIRQLNWATYLVDTSGQCRFSPQETTVWLTDGYGDFVRHYLRAMAAYPTIAPDDANHLLSSTSVVTNISYQPQEIIYHTYDTSAYETLRLTTYPMEVKVNGVPTPRLSTLNGQGWTWTNYPNGGVLKVRHDTGRTVDITTHPSSVKDISVRAMILSAFPNPAIDRINIKRSENSSEELRLSINDIMGREVSSAIWHAGSSYLTINCSTFTSGIYLIVARDNQGRLVANQKMVKE